MKNIIILFVLLFAVVSFAGSSNHVNVAFIAPSSGSYSDIIFYHDCEALDNANKSEGSATVTYDAGILLETSSPILGSGSWDNNNDGYDNVSFAISGNVDFVSGRIGLFWKPNEAGDGEIVYTIGNDFYADYYSATQIRVHWGDNTSFITLNYSVSTTYFIEFKFDGLVCSVYLDGTLKGSATSSGAVVIDDTNFGIGAGGSSSWDSWYDQIISTDDEDRSLYAIRNTTNFD